MRYFNVDAQLNSKTCHVILGVSVQASYYGAWIGLLERRACEESAQNRRRYEAVVKGTENYAVEIEIHQGEVLDMYEAYVERWRRMILIYRMEKTNVIITNL